MSAVPFNQVWPGYQRPVDQTQLSSFACWEQSKDALVEIACPAPVETATIRPLSRGIAPEVSGNLIRFALNDPAQVVVEVNGRFCLHLFADTPEEDAASAPDTIRFGPGIHRPGIISLESGQTLFLAPGAVVYGAVRARHAQDIRIAGRGIIDASGFQRGEAGGCIRLSDCHRVLIEGVVLRDPDVWCLSAFGCSDLVISGVKLIGLWRYNSDGIDICNCQNVAIRNSFVRSFDDSIVVKGIRDDREPYDDRPCRNIVAEGCVVWNDWGRALEIGAETCAPEMSEISFRDCDILRATHVAMDIQHGDRAEVHDITFEDIRVEMDAAQCAPRIQRSREQRYVPEPADRFLPRLCVIDIRPTMWSKDEEIGTVRRVTYRNISVVSPSVPESVFRGYDEERDVQDVAVENLRVNNTPIRTVKEGNIAAGPFASGIRVAPGGGLQE